MNARSGIQSIGMAVGLLGLVAGSTLAADAADPSKATMSPAQIIKAVEAAGYTNVRDLEFDDGRWELEATSPSGAAVDLEVDANTGKVLHEEAD